MTVIQELWNLKNKPNFKDLVKEAIFAKDKTLMQQQKYQEVKKELRARVQGGATDLCIREIKESYKIKVKKPSMAFARTHQSGGSAMEN